MRISDWSSDVCSSDLRHDLARSGRDGHVVDAAAPGPGPLLGHRDQAVAGPARPQEVDVGALRQRHLVVGVAGIAEGAVGEGEQHAAVADPRSEEHTSELQSLMRISYAVFCWKQKKQNII